MPYSPIRSPLIILVLWGAGLGAAAQFGKFSILFDRIKDHYPAASPVMLGVIVSVVGMVGLVFGTTAGLLVQRIGYRRILVLALGAGAFLSAAEVFFPPLPLLIVLRVLEGASHLAIVVAAPVMIAQTASLRHLGFAMTLWSSFFAVSFAVTAWLGLPLVDQFGDGALFLAHAVYMLIFALLVWVALPADPATAAPIPTFRAILAGHRRIYTSPRLSAPAMGFFCYTLVYVAFLTLLPPMIGGAWQAPLATAMPLVSIAVSMTVGVWLLRHVTAIRIVQAAFLMAALASVILYAVWGQGMPAFVTALILAGTLGLVQGASFAAIAELNPTAEGRAQAAGAIAQLGNLGTTSGTPVLAALIAWQGAAGLSLFMLIPSVLGIVLHQVQARRRRYFVE